MRWHYTVGIKMRLIVQDGYLKPSNTNAPAGEKPGVYFTTRETFEPTAVPSRVNAVTREKWDFSSLEELAQWCDGLYRIGVSDDYPLHPWLKLCRLARIGERYRRGLEKFARGVGSNPYTFWGTLRPVPIEDWAAVERFADGRWVPIEELVGNRPVTEVADYGAIADKRTMAAGTHGEESGTVGDIDTGIEAAG